MMRVGIVNGQNVHVLSTNNYISNIIQRLQAFGVEFVPVACNSNKFAVDLFWVLTSSAWCFRGSGLPQVISMLGDYGLDISLRDFFGKITLSGIMWRWRIKVREIIKYKVMEPIIKKVIVPSNYAKYTLEKHLKIKKEKIEVIYHGVDMSVFCPNGEIYRNIPYFLHLSQWIQPFSNQKNIPRILKAYELLRSRGYNIPMLLLIPGYSDNIEIDGVILINQRLSSKEVAKLYRGAIALVFPSLHETFGFPILEAMACGCPVITSNKTACPEIAGDAALLVNPYSVQEICQAMELIILDDDLRNALREKGLKRVKSFSWEASAQRHFEVFESICRGN